MNTLVTSYLRQRRLCLAMLAVFCLVFGGMLFLYRMPLEGAIYGGALCAAILAGALAVDWHSWRRRHEELARLAGEERLELEKLPEPEGRIEADYQLLLEREALAHRRLEAEQAERRREREDYYTLWTHQIKTPLSAMKLLLQEQAVPRRGELQAELLKTEQYAEMALAYVRAGAEATDFLLKPCPLEGAVRQTVRRLAPLFILKDLRVELGALEGSPVTDEKWLCFALEQVLTNAVKYTPPGGTISVQARGALLTVRDSGMGIAPEDLPRVFEKGFTGRNGREDKRASGIGLYLTRKMMDRLGHEVTISSQPGEGTAVTFDLSSRKIEPI